MTTAKPAPRLSFQDAERAVHRDVLAATDDERLAISQCIFEQLAARQTRAIICLCVHLTPTASGSAGGTWIDVDPRARQSHERRFRRYDSGPVERIAREDLSTAMLACEEGYQRMMRAVVFLDRIYMAWYITRTHITAEPHVSRRTLGGLLVRMFGGPPDRQLVEYALVVDAALTHTLRTSAVQRRKMRHFVAGVPPPAAQQAPGVPRSPVAAPAPAAPVRSMSASASTTSATLKRGDSGRGDNASSSSSSSSSISSFTASSDDEAERRSAGFMASVTVLLPPSPVPVAKRPGAKSPGSSETAPTSSGSGGKFIPVLQTSRSRSSISTERR